MNKLLCAVMVLCIVCVVGCQRIKTEAAGGGDPKHAPQYDEKLQRPDPNQPGNKQ